MIWFSSIDPTTHSWNSHLWIFLNLCKLFMAGIAVHISSLFVLFAWINGLQATMYGSRKSHYPSQKCHENEEKIDNDYVLRNDHRIKTQPISMILVSIFSEDNAYLMKSKYAIFFNIKVTKIEHSTFLGHPVYFTSFLLFVKEHQNFGPWLFSYSESPNQKYRKKEQWHWAKKKKMLALNWILLWLDLDPRVIALHFE